MSVLNAATRAALKASDFALPKDRAYPIHDLAHARDALARVAQNGSPEEKATVRAAVKKRYPKIDAGSAGGMSPNEAPASKGSM